MLHLDATFTIVHFYKMKILLQIKLYKNNTKIHKSEILLQLQLYKKS